MSIDNSGSAFPVSWPDASPDLGMSLRDYFAGKALCTTAGYGNLEDWSPSQFARHTYAIADAMLVERANIIGSLENKV